MSTLQTHHDQHHDASKASAPAAGQSRAQSTMRHAKPGHAKRASATTKPVTPQAHAPKSQQAAAETTQAAPRRSRYIPALDGIRALAVIAVVLYHLNFSWAQGGFLGVTIFFVLSGYLITRLLIAEFEQNGRIDLKSFWIRRIRRLVPATVTLVIVVAVLCTVFNHVMLTKMRPDILPSLLFFNNWWQIAQNVSYFDALGDPSPLTHFWSLAIEEQFYVLWPILLFALLRLRVKRPSVRRLVLVLTAVSALAMALLYNPAADPSRVYYGTDTRAFSMLMGAWLAFIPEGSMAPMRLLQTVGLGRLLPATRAETPKNATIGRSKEANAASARPARPSRSLDLLGIAALAGLIAMTVLCNGYTPFMYRGGTVLCSLLGLVLIAACVQPDGILAQVFSIKPLVWLGQRSYSIYLWHYPLLALMNPVSNIGAVPWWMYLVQLAVVLAVAECSYRFIETPFRHGALGAFVRSLRAREITIPGFVRSHAVRSALVGILVLAAAGGIAFVPSTSALSKEGAELIQQNTEDAPEGSNNAATAQAGDATDADADGFPDGAYDILMIGDSVSLRTVDTFNSTFPHGHIDAAKNRQFSAGKELFQGYADQNLAGKVVVFALGTNGPVNDEAIDSLMDAVGDQRYVVFITTRSPRQWVQSTNDALKRAAERYGNVHVIDWYAYSEGRNDLFDGDGTHLSASGAEEYISLVQNEVKGQLPFHFEGAERDRVTEQAVAYATDLAKKVAAAFGRSEAASS